MAKVVYSTSDGDVLDEICYRYYGDDVTPLPSVYNANPGLADQGVIFGIGVKITLPDIPNLQRNVVQIVLPWTKKA